MYKHMANGSTVDDYLARLRDKYDNDRTTHTVAFLDSFYADRKKVCKTYTRRFRNMDHTATVIAESKNSSFKHKGKLNAELQKYTMAELGEQMVKWESDNDFETQKRIEASLVIEDYDERPWSNWVDKHWDDKIKRWTEVGEKVEKGQLEHEYLVTKRAAGVSTYCVRVWFLPSCGQDKCGHDHVPRCECSWNVMTGLPCTCTNGVAITLNTPPKKKCYLDKRHHLERHPFFVEACDNLGFDPADYGANASTLFAHR